MTSDENVSKFAGTGVTALKNGAKAADELSALGKDAVTFSSGVSGISPAVQDNLSEAARKPIFGEMSSIVKGKTSAEDAVSAVIEKLGE